MLIFAHAAGSVLFITLDSCRFDTFAAADTPHLKAVGPLYRAMAPSHFTYGSHMAMFVGFTPGVADGASVPYANPKFGRLFKLRRLGHPGRVAPVFELEGRNIIEGFRRRGLRALGTGSVGWFDPETPAAAALIGDFDRFFYPGENWGALRAQLRWVEEQLAVANGPVFLFMNLGETHVPYHHEGAAWDVEHNPCVPFGGANNDAAECRRRQTASLEFIDAELAPLLAAFAPATTLICGDHGDAWGEDGLWEHGIFHEKVFEVPLVLGLRGEPNGGSQP